MRHCCAGGKTWLACFNDSAVQQETGTLLRGVQDVYPSSLMRSAVWLGGLIQGSRVGRELLVGPGKALPTSPEVKVAHNAGP